MTRTQNIYVDGLTFDYAHMIPGHPKCGRLHGHTSTVRVEVSGRLGAYDMVIDFGLMKQAAEDALDSLDHRLLVNRRYVTGSGPQLRVEYQRSNGRHCLDVPADEVVTLDGEPTIELIAELVLALVQSRLHQTGVELDSVVVRCTEGLAKGAMAAGGSE